MQKMFYTQCITIIQKVSSTLAKNQNKKQTQTKNKSYNEVTSALATLNELMQGLVSSLTLEMGIHRGLLA